MARIRTLKPEFPQSETIGKLSRDARLLFIQIWTIVDDEGRTRAASRMLASLLYPYDDDAPALIDGWLGELEHHGCVRRYEVDGSSYLDIPNWLKHQKIDRPSSSKLPPFRDAIASPREPSRSFDADLGPRTMDLGEEEEASASSAHEPEREVEIDAYPKSSDRMIGEWPEGVVTHHRRELVAAYGGGMDAPTDIGIFNTWVAAYGWDPAVIAATVAGNLTPARKGKRLKYWEGAVREVMEKRAASGPPPPPNETPAQTRKRLGAPDPKDRTPQQWERPVDRFFLTGGVEWVESLFGPPPGHPGCFVPAEVIQQMHVRYDWRPKAVA